MAYTTELGRWNLAPQYPPESSRDSYDPSRAENRVGIIGALGRRPRNSLLVWAQPRFSPQRPLGGVPDHGHRPEEVDTLNPSPAHCLPLI